MSSEIRIRFLRLLQFFVISLLLHKLPFCRNSQSYLRASTGCGNSIQMFLTVSHRHRPTEIYVEHWVHLPRPLTYRSYVSRSGALVERPAYSKPTDKGRLRWLAFSAWRRRFEMNIPTSLSSSFKSSKRYFRRAVGCRRRP